VKIPELDYLPIGVWLALVLIALSYLFPNLDGPAGWLNAWTAWIAKYAALIIAAQKSWKLADTLNEKLKEWHP